MVREVIHMSLRRKRMVMSSYSVGLWEHRMMLLLLLLELRNSVVL